jgi:2,5-dihydroxypyridine 5,6-dioxygenase
MKQIEMIKGAKKMLDDCMNVKKGENVLIILDTSMPWSIAETLAMACKEREAEPTIIIMSPVPVDGNDPPPPVAEAMQKAQVIFLGSRGIFHSPSRIRAVSAGARSLTIVGYTEEDMFRGVIEVNFLEAKEVSARVADALRKAKEARITTPAGTDIYLDLRGRLEKIITMTGIYHHPGEGGSLSLEVAISPRIGTAQGVIVCDASTTLLRPGLIKEPVRLKVRDGIVTEITGGSEAREISDLLAAMGDPSVYNVVELGIGLNPKATMTGSHKDKAVYGTCHIGIGSNVAWGGNIKAATHCDLIMYAPKIDLDGKIILENYQLNL